MRSHLTLPGWASAVGRDPLRERTRSNHVETSTAPGTSYVSGLSPPDTSEPPPGFRVYACRGRTLGTLEREAGIEPAPLGSQPRARPSCYSLAPSQQPILNWQAGHCMVWWRHSMVAPHRWHSSIRGRAASRPRPSATAVLHVAKLVGWIQRCPSRRQSSHASITHRARPPRFLRSGTADRGSPQVGRRP